MIASCVSQVDHQRKAKIEFLQTGRCSCLFMEYYSWAIPPQPRSFIKHSFYINNIIPCKIKRDNYQVPKIVGDSGIKQILRKWNKNLRLMQVTKHRICWFISLFEKCLFSLKKRFSKSFSRKNIFNSCIENICISICIKWITAKKKNSYQNWFREI